MQLVLWLCSSSLAVYLSGQITNCRKLPILAAAADAAACKVSAAVGVSPAVSAAAAAAAVSAAAASRDRQKPLSS